MKSDKTIIRKNHMEQTNYIKILLKIKDNYIKIMDIIDIGRHHEILNVAQYKLLEIEVNNFSL